MAKDPSRSERRITLISALREAAEPLGYKARVRWPNSLEDRVAVVELKASTVNSGYDKFYCEGCGPVGQIVIPPYALPDIALVLNQEGKVEAAQIAEPPEYVRGNVSAGKFTIVSLNKTRGKLRVFSASALDDEDYHGKNHHLELPNNDEWKGVSFGLWGSLNPLPKGIDTPATFFTHVAYQGSKPLDQHNPRDDTLVAYSPITIGDEEVFKPSISLGLSELIIVDPCNNEAVVYLPSSGNSTIPAESYKDCPFTTKEGYVVSTFQASPKSPGMLPMVGVVLKHNGTNQSTKVQVLPRLSASVVKSFQNIIRAHDLVEKPSVDLSLIGVEGIIGIDRIIAAVR